MQFIDTHTHLYLPEFDTDRDEVVNRALSGGVIKMLMPNIDIHSVEQMLSVKTKFPDICFAMIGLHPTSVKEDYLFQLHELETLATQYKFIAVGEIGIDLYWDKTLLNTQIIAFRRQIAFAVDRGLPVVIHSRDSFKEVFSVLDEFAGEGLKGVLHAFSGNTEDARKATGMGLKLGIGGIVTFKNSGLDKTVRETGIDSLITETDSPYLAPVPHRGKRNESSYIYIINKKLAEIFGLSEEEVASITYSNSTGLFSL